MRSAKHFLVTAAVVTFMTALGWRYGYTAAMNGEDSSVTGAIYVALGIAVLVAAIKWLAIVWRLSTVAGPGVSPLRHIALAVGIIMTAIVLIGVLSPLALESDSFSLGIVMAAAAFALWYLAKREGLMINRHQRASEPQPDDEAVPY